MDHAIYPAGRRKRRRKIWACNECRRRKVQCDRDQPVCGGCRKAGLAADCQYVDALNNTILSRDHVSADSLTSNSVPSVAAVQPSLHDRDLAADPPRDFAALERRLNLLESRTASEVHAQKDFIPPVEKSSSGLDQDDHTLYDDRNYTVLHGRTFRTKFHGGTFPGTLAQCIPGLDDFTTDAFAAFPVLEDVRQIVSGAQQAVLSVPRNGLRTTRAALIALLDDRESIELDIQDYMKDHDHIYHILHGPTFERDYAQMWLDIEAADARQIILVLLMVAIVRYSRISARGETESWQQATTMIDLCEDVLQSSVQKYDCALDFQITFLILLGRQLSGKWYKRTWVNAGNTIRIWMCAGLHRSVDALHSKPTVLTQELRARLWAAAAEFELQAAFAHGMSGHTWPEQSDIAPPLNVPDAALAQDLLPEESREYTATTFLATSSKSLRLRHHLNSLLNGVFQNLTWAQVNAYSDELHRVVDALAQDKDSQPGVINVLLTINVLQYALALHVRMLQHSKSPTEKRASRVSLVHTASMMLQHHKTAIELQSQVVEVMYGDHVRIALSVCYCYFTATPQSDCIITAAIETRSFEVMRTITSLMKNKVKHSRGSRHQFWLTAAALGLMQARMDPAQRTFYLEEAVRLFLEPYAHLLQEQRMDTRPQEDRSHPTEQNAIDHTAFGTPTQLDLSIDEWFYQWCDNPTTWPSDI